MKKKRIRLSPNQIIAIGFLSIILAGALLLMLPAWEGGRSEQAAPPGPSPTASVPASTPPKVLTPEELLARLRALTRRQGQGEPPAPQGLAFADLRLDPSARSLHREGKSVQLSPKEFELLRLLMGRAGAVCPKGEILDRLWGGAEDNNLEAYISFLRKKFFYLGSRASIATLRKVGYRLDDPDRPA